MKLFLSWSGEISHKIANTLRDWVPLVLQTVEPYVSSEDIDKGARWSTDIAKELEESSFGIICITKENLNAPWINFEAGALSKAIDKSNVAPFLFNIKKSEVKGPLIQFQLTIYEKNDMRKLLHSINNSSNIVLEKTKLDRIFDQWWPTLEENLDVVMAECNKKKPDEKQEDSEIEPSNKILEELLELSRIQTRILSNPEEILPINYLQYILKQGENKVGSISKNAIIDLQKRYRSIRLLTNEYLRRENDNPLTEAEVEILRAIDRLALPINHIAKHSNTIIDSPIEKLDA